MGKVVYEHKQNKAQKRLTEVQAARAELKYQEEKAEFEAKKRAVKMAEEKVAKERHDKGEYTFWEKFGLMIIGGAIFLTSFTMLSVIAMAIIGFVVGAGLVVMGFFKMKKIKSEIEKIKTEQIKKEENTYVVCASCGATKHDRDVCEYCGSKL